MNQAVLVINCGSSSVKFALINVQSEQSILSGIAEQVGSQEATLSWNFAEKKSSKQLPGGDLVVCLGVVLALIPSSVEVIAIGHRVVHGGEMFSQSVVINSEVIAAIEACNALAPLHNPVNLAGVSAAKEVFPELVHVGVFDTAFHQTMPASAYLYAVPYDWYSEHGVRRYGFHGTSHRYVAQEAARRLNLPEDQLSAVIAHLGNGCSACAVERGRSVDTTMGVTPLEGLVMGTRSGDIDPSLHEFIAKTKGWDLARVMQALNRESGLLGISGSSNDMRAVESLAAEGDERAQLALDVFAYRLAKSILGMTAGLSKIDAIVFTGGIGENSDLIRSKTLHRLQILGVAIDVEANSKNGADTNGKISLGESISCLVVPTNEELMIARETLQLI